MTRRFLVVTILALALAVAACSSSSSGGNLSGTSWAMTGFEGLMGAGLEDLPTSGVTLAFGSDGTVSGKGACNTFSGTYTTDGSALKIPPFASTMMACPGDLGTWETAYFTFITGNPNYSMNGDTLELSGASTKVTYTKS
jgi:heat shock protein HslJ